MSGPLDDLDARLLADVRRLEHALDPVPPGLADRIKIAMTLAALDAELAELTAPLASVRAAPEQTDALTFTGSSLSLLLTVAEREPASIALDGWTSEPRTVIEVHHGDGVDSTVADDTGRLTLRIARGPVWFVLRPADDRPDLRPVVTPTVTL